MSFDALERSSFGARPRALYEFNLGTSSWRYGTGDVETVVPGIGSFAPTVILDEGVTQSGSPDNEDVTISLPRTTAVAGLYKTLAPSEPVFVVIRRYNEGADDAPVMWVGTVKAASGAGLNEVALKCRMMAASLDRQGLRLGWQRTCPHALYDRLCKVDPAAYRITFPLQSLSGAAIFSADIQALTAGRSFRGGYIEFPLNGAIERRAIDTQIGPSFQLLEGTDGMAVGMAISAYPGCARTTDACKSFNNFPANYGGFPHMPGKSPFDGSPVF